MVHESSGDCNWRISSNTAYVSTGCGGYHDGSSFCFGIVHKAHGKRGVIFNIIIWLSSWERHGAFWLVPWARDNFPYSPLREIKLNARSVDAFWWKKPMVGGCCWISWSGISEQLWIKFSCEADSSLWREKFSAEVPPRADRSNCKLWSFARNDVMYGFGFTLHQNLRLGESTLDTHWSSLKADRPRFLQERTATNPWVFIQPSRSHFREMPIDICLFSCLLLNGFLTV